MPDAAAEAMAHGISCETAAMKLPMASLALAFAIAGSVGCHSSKATTAQAPAPKLATGPTCDQVADHMRDEMVRAGTEDTTDISRLVPVFRRVVAERCVADAWSADALACMATAVGDQMNACEAKFTAEQNSSMSKAVDAAFNEEVMKPGASQSKSVAPPPDGAGAPPDDPCGGGE